MLPLPVKHSTDSPLRSSALAWLTRLLIVAPLIISGLLAIQLWRIFWRDCFHSIRSINMTKRSPGNSMINTRLSWQFRVLLRKVGLDIQHLMLVQCLGVILAHILWPTNASAGAAHAGGKNIFGLAGAGVVLILLSPISPLRRSP